MEGRRKESEVGGDHRGLETAGTRETETQDKNDNVMKVFDGRGIFLFVFEHFCLNLMCDWSLKKTKKDRQPHFLLLSYLQIKLDK